MVYEVKDSNGELIALHIKGDVLPKGIKFFTGAEMPIQVAQMSHPGGHLIRPHVHNKRETVITSTSEVLVIKSGKLKAIFYSNEKIFIESRVLEENDIAVIVSGGHSFEVLEQCHFIEVKQGPFDLTNDKTLFEV
jgi:hypothetical protein